ncbi:hypothetical protein CRE_19558 [Caenorhabditis remanei]|uniref:Uncharacterized protein n=1 Tax=Caenorhabditis remanei TaxID=31234 RepID=E3NLG2_CAERE|nr:hypothetical protein CRE_19558 [Caenorhabditis remanei]
MKLKKYHVIPYVEGAAVESAKRFLEKILNDPNLDAGEKCKFYQDVLYRIKHFNELPIVNQEILTILKENMRAAKVEIKPEVKPKFETEMSPPFPLYDSETPEEIVDQSDDEFTSVDNIPVVRNKRKTSESGPPTEKRYLASVDDDTSSVKKEFPQKWKTKRPKLVMRVLKKKPSIPIHEIEPGAVFKTDNVGPLHQYRGKDYRKVQHRVPGKRDLKRFKMGRKLEEYKMLRHRKRKSRETLENEAKRKKEMNDSSDEEEEDIKPKRKPKQEIKTELKREIKREPKREIKSEKPIKKEEIHGSGPRIHCRLWKFL